MKKISILLFSIAFLLITLMGINIWALATDFESISTIALTTFALCDVVIPLILLCVVLYVQLKKK